MVKENKFSPMVISLKAITKMEDRTDKENMNGLMEVIIKANSKTVIDKVWEYFVKPMVLSTKVTF
jgi:hypothetical protein